MKPFLKTKAGIISVALFALVMGVMFHRVAARNKSSATNVTRVAGPEAAPRPSAAVEPAARTKRMEMVAENAAYLPQYYESSRGVREERDRQGNALIRRPTAATPADSGRVTVESEPSPTPLPSRTSLRFAGGNRKASAAALRAPRLSESKSPAETAGGASEAGAAPVGRPLSSARLRRFNPYGSVIKCELVFTIDSTNEQTPFIGVVMEPVYNNGQLVIPAGAELHGTARPDRLRDRIFSGTDWVLVFPREHDRPNGRQLNVQGVALDRVEPDANGMTWGITDGSYGLEGTVIRTMNDEEIRRFAAVFLASGAQALQDRQTDRIGQQSARNNPQNAVLQGLSANFQKIADDISAEIARNGVFIRVPAGHQFYFYPTQIIDPDAAGVSSDVATVK